MLNLRRAPLLHTDERGWSVDPLLAAAGSGFVPQNVHLVSLAPGCVRGNHYHRYQRERLCIFGSRARIAIVDRHSGLREEIDLAGEEPWLLEVAPGIAHAVKNIGRQTLYLLCYADRAFDPKQPDMVREIVLEGEAPQATER